MKKLKISIVIFIIIIAFLLTGILTLNIFQSKRQQIKAESEDTYNNENEIPTSEEEQKVANMEYNKIDEREYINIEKCITGFLATTNKNNTAYFSNDGKKTTSEKEISELTLELLSEDYITQNKIDTNNISKYTYNINEDVFYIPISVNKFYGDSTVNSFVVEGLIENQNYENITESKLILNLDTANKTYSIEVLNKQDDINKITPKKIDSIQEKTINTYNIDIINDEDIIKEIVKLYKRTILGYPELFYKNYLQNEYKNTKFQNINDFKSYIEKNKLAIQQFDVNKYKIINDNNSKSYSLLDKYENNLIIEYNSIINYKVLLDSYTLDLDNVKENYDKGDDSVKVGIQVGKFKQMLNSKDYDSIYSHLNEKFKNDNFKSVSDLKNYLNNNVYAINSIEIQETSQKDDYYVCNGIIKNQQNQNEQKSIVIAIKLIGSNKFELSFSIK